ncbi:MAG: hypothetical protein GY812_06000 [Actinomycetia bacterium]|nr:hypothetical protein [Actinomycetes bacterium]
MQQPPPKHLTLEDTAALVTGHLELEEALFRLTGVWSTDADAASGSTGAALQSFFAVESAQHGWRAEQWERRLPRSVRARPDAASKRWAPVLASAVEVADAEQRLALWSIALGPALAERYRAHLALCADAADRGVLRWLSICVADLQRATLEALGLLGECLQGDRNAEICSSAAVSLADLISS